MAIPSLSVIASPALSGRGNLNVPPPPKIASSLSLLAMTMVKRVLAMTIEECLLLVRKRWVTM
jgi:hypothetical protein